MGRPARARASEGTPGARLVEGEAGRPPSLEVCVTADHGAPELVGEVLLSALRERSSRASVRALGRDEGYRVEDLTDVAIAMPTEEDAARLASWMARRLGRAVEHVARPGRPTVAATFAGRVGGSPERARYARGEDGRVRVEAFEVHVTEHCNLRCSSCCNMSPLVAKKTLELEEVRAIVTRMASAVRADVIKIMGGEPLLHPDIAGVIRMLRASNIAPRVRLFTNGLLLGRMGDAFWEALDELTISNYSSAPVKPAFLALARERARRHDFVLNVKPVDEFTQVLSPHYQHDDARTQATFERCWLRHRCLVARGGRFYMCTRAAYGDDFVARVAHEAMPLDRSQDGVALDEPDLAGAIEAYMNRDRPLGACRYCFGGDGAVEPHAQLTRAEVEAGILSRRLPLAR